jgi:tetratricopeptide (TPR) repeat protein
MSSKEITELRKKGNLEEALKMASEMLESTPDDIWVKRAAAWVYYEYLKKYSQPNTFDKFIEFLDSLKKLYLPEDEKMVFDNSAWQIGSLVYALQKEDNVAYNKLNRIFESIKEFHFTKPSESYSFLYKAFHKGYQKWSQYETFAEWWGFENFTSEDYLKTEYNDRKIMALAEQAYIAYSKKLLEGEPIDGIVQVGVPMPINKEKVNSFLPKLDKVIEDHPDYQYPPYFKAKLLLSLGTDENVLDAFLPFAKQKRNDFWVWELMAEIFSEDKDTQFACYCKALSLNTPEDFLVKLRQTFAGMLIERGLYNEATTEIEQIISTREKHDWKLPYEISQWTESDWYKEVRSNKNNKSFYLKHIKKAEEILFQDIPEEVVVVEFVNENKKMLNFVKNKDKIGFFNYSEHLKKPLIGDLLKVRFNGDGQDGYFKALTVKNAEPNTSSAAVKKIEGDLKIIEPQNFGFLEDVFVEPNIIQKNQLKDGQSIKGQAILSFNKKKDVWGWKLANLDA